MGAEKSAGTTIGVVAGQPATFNEAGYEALTYARIGEVTDGGSHGRSYTPITHNPLDKRGTQKFKGSFNEGDKQLQVAYDRTDAGQIVLKAALDSDGDYSFQVLYPDGSADYFQAKVMGIVKGGLTANGLRTATVTLAITTNSAGVGIVEVAP